jgi:hypothetical protein
MKSISYLSIAVISAISLSSINSLCMEKQISCTSNPPCTNRLMDIIKEQLIIKEIKKQGIECIQKKIYSAILFQSCRNYSKQPVLVIQKTFFKPKKNDPLTKHIFNAISLRKSEHNKQSPKTALSKFLCDEIRYYGIKNKPAVLVKASFTNAEEVQKIIDGHKSTMANNRIDNNVNPMPICALFVFGLSYLLIHHFIASN